VVNKEIDSNKLRICITGSSGFIGTNLSDHLKDRDDLELIPFEGDLLAPKDIDLFFEKYPKIDLIIHMVGLFQSDFDKLLLINVAALNNLLEAAVHNKIKKVIFTSTGAVYGEPIQEKSLESDPLRPNTLYGLSKKYAEECVLFYAKNFGLEYVILRLANVYGGGSRQGVVYNFIEGAKKDHEITIFGDGTQSRNFLHVLDACRGIERAISYKKSGIFNISNPKKITLNNLAEILKKKYQFDVIYQPSNNNLKNLLLDTSKAQKELGFESMIKEIELS